MVSSVIFSALGFFIFFYSLLGQGMTFRKTLLKILLKLLAVPF